MCPSPGCKPPQTVLRPLIREVNLYVYIRLLVRRLMLVHVLLPFMTFHPVNKIYKPYWNLVTITLCQHRYLSFKAYFLLDWSTLRKRFLHVFHKYCHPRNANQKTRLTLLYWYNFVKSLWQNKLQLSALALICMQFCFGLTSGSMCGWYFNFQMVQIWFRWCIYILALSC